MTVSAAQATEERHHALSLAQGEVGFQHKAGMPARGGGLEALVLSIGHLEEQQQGVGEHHERMFARRQGFLRSLRL